MSTVLNWLKAHFGRIIAHKWNVGGGHFPSGVQIVNRGLSRVRTRAILNRHEAPLYCVGNALYNAVQAEFPFYALFVAVHGVQGNFQGRCNL